MNEATADVPETWWKENNLLSIIQWNESNNNDQVTF